MKTISGLLDGHKTQIGVVLLFIAGGLKAVGVIDENVFQAVVIFLGAWTAYGIRDAIKKLE